MDKIVQTKIKLKIALAKSPLEIQAAQRLRFGVFAQELGANITSSENIDADSFDEICDHLLVTREDNGELVGTYRLLRQEIAERNFGFYSQKEFDLQPLLKRKPELRFMELGRSCILKPYRGKAVLELLWQGIWDYAREHRIDVMIGCASFSGVNVEDHAQSLSFLSQQFNLPPQWSVSAHSKHYQNMKLTDFNNRKALSTLPPLIKAYLRLGCYIGDGAVIDHAFNTIDVLIILPVANIDQKYFKFYGAP